MTQSITTIQNINTLTLSIATIRSIGCRSEVATRQLLQDIAALEPKKASKLIQKIYDTLSIEDQKWLKAVICPGLS
jgi:hypothetical protein